MTKKQIPKKPITATIPANGKAFKSLKISLGMIIGVFAFLLYAQSIAYDYTLDDHPAIDQNKITTKGIAGIPTLLKTDYWYGYLEIDRGPVYRPTSLIMFAIEWQLFPNNPHINHFMNVLLYAFTCWLLFVVLCELFEKSQNITYSLLFPFICSLLYTTHPIHTEVVNNIKSRDEILCFLFGILSFFFVLKYISDNSIPYLILLCISFFLLLISKESGITFLITIPLTAFVFTKVAPKKMIVISSMLILVSLLYFLIRMQVLKDVRWNISDSYNNTTLLAAPSFISREATAFYVLLRYILLLIFPHPLCCDYNYAQIKNQTLSDPFALIAIVVNLGLGLYALINLRKKTILAFGILFYFIAIASVSNVFLIIGVTMAERFLYIPSLGFCFILTYLIIKFTNNDNIKFKDFKEYISLNRNLLFIVFIIAGLYTAKTFSRSMDWKNDYTIYSHDSKISNNSSTVHYIYGLSIIYYVYPKEKDSTIKTTLLDKAITEIKRSIAIWPTADSYRELGHCYDLKNDNINSISIFQILVNNSKHPDSSDCEHLANAFYNLGLQYNNERKFDLSLSTFDSALKYKPDFSLAYNNKGVAYLNKAMNKEAFAAFEESIRLDPKCEKAYMNIGCVYSNTGQFEKAFEYYNKAINLDSTDYQPFYFMGITYQAIGDKVNAKQYLEKANRIGGSQQR